MLNVLLPLGLFTDQVSGHVKKLVLETFPYPAIHVCAYILHSLLMEFPGQLLSRAEDCNNASLSLYLHSAKCGWPQRFLLHLYHYLILPFKLLLASVCTGWTVGCVRPMKEKKTKKRATLWGVTFLALGFDNKILQSFSSRAKAISSSHRLRFHAWLFLRCFFKTHGWRWFQILTEAWQQTKQRKVEIIFFFFCLNMKLKAGMCPCNDSVGRYVEPQWGNTNTLLCPSVHWGVLVSWQIDWHSWRMCFFFISQEVVFIKTPEAKCTL